MLISRAGVKRTHKLVLLVVAVILVILLTPVALFVHWFVKPYTTRSDLREALGSRLNGDAALASEICGKPVDRFISPPTKTNTLRYGESVWADVSIESWKPIFAREGELTARVTGIGADRDQKPLGEERSARLRFAYRCWWSDNGRVNQFTCELTSGPVVVH